MSMPVALGERIGAWAASAVKHPVGLEHLSTWLDSASRSPVWPVPLTDSLTRATLTLGGDDLKVAPGEDIAATISGALKGELERRKVRVWERPMFLALVEPDSRYNVPRHEREHWQVIKDLDSQAYIQLFLAGVRFSPYPYSQYWFTGVMMHNLLSPEVDALCASAPQVLSTSDVRQAKAACWHVRDQSVKSTVERRLAERPRIIDEELRIYAYSMFSSFS